MNSLGGNGIILKGKTHIIDRVYKVNGYMETINHSIQVEAGAGNNQIVPKPKDLTVYSKITNIGKDVKVFVRFGKNGKERTTSINLGPDEKYNSIALFIQGEQAPGYMMSTLDFWRGFLSDRYEFQRLTDADYTNTEEHNYKWE